MGELLLSIVGEVCSWLLGLFMDLILEGGFELLVDVIIDFFKGGDSGRR